MSYPLTKQDLLGQITRETARMSYPGSMSRGVKQVVTAGTKTNLEDYFAAKFPLHNIWDDAREISGYYDAWHEQPTKEIGRFLRTYERET